MTTNANETRGDRKERTMGIAVTNRVAGEVGSWKYENEWALARALTAFEPRLEAVEVQFRSKKSLTAMIRYETAPGAARTDASVRDINRTATAFMNGWSAANATRREAEQRARDAAFANAKR